MKVVWREEALDDLDILLAYIADRNETAAVSLRADFEACADRLPDHPFLYRAGRIAGTREAVIHPNYILIYRVLADEIEIISVIHSRREYPPSD